MDIDTCDIERKQLKLGLEDQRCAYMLVTFAITPDFSGARIPIFKIMQGLFWTNRIPTYKTVLAKLRTTEMINEAEREQAVRELKEIEIGEFNVGKVLNFPTKGENGGNNDKMD